MIDDLESFAEEPLNSRRRGLSLIWVIPLTALLIGAWIAWLNWSKRGPEIQIIFQDVEGLEEGKSKVRFRSLDIGKVTSLTLTEDHQQVVATAEMKKDTERFLSQGTRFWVVKPRMELGNVSGLQTLISGSYIEMDIGNQEPDGQREFVGLEKPPSVSIDTPGRRFSLYALKRGSVAIGSPIFFRNIKAGIITDVKLVQERQWVSFDAFIHAPFDKMVTKNTVFWEASGINVQLGPSGVEVNLESIEAMVRGGVAFDLPKGVGAGEAVEEHFLYHLYPNQAKADRQRSYESTRHTLYFTDSVRGLAVGAPVEFNGIRMGEVLSIGAEYDTETLVIRIPVVIEIERGILRPAGAKPEHPKGAQEVLATLIKNGLRATLKSENLLTGAQFIDLVVLPGAEPPKDLEWAAAHGVIPTVPSGLNLLQQRIDTLFARLDALPIEKIGHKMDSALGELHQALIKLNLVLEPFGKKAEPLSVQVENALKRTSGAMRSVDQAVAPNSQLQTQLLQTLNDFSSASTAIRDLARYLERNPQSLLLGKPSR